MNSETTNASETSLNMRVGDWVVVRTKEEILKTLDSEGKLDGMPFMPEMFAFCGQRFQVHKSAHKTCDTVNPVRSRRLNNTVHLKTRCDGSAHGGCQAGCLLFWNRAWLMPANERSGTSSAASGPTPSSSPKGCTEEDVNRATTKESAEGLANPTYTCQATQLPNASQDLSPYEFGQYIEDYTSGNVGLGKWLRGMLYISYENLINLGVGWGPALRWFYDRFQSLWGGLPYPRAQGKLPMDGPTPTAHLNLQEGEMVKVKSYEEILATCNTDNKNRGMGFDGEQLPFCGGTYRVHKRVTKIINERSGKMMNMKNPCIILEDVFCQGRYSACRMFCAREIYSYWREIWLERVESGKPSKTGAQ